MKSAAISAALPPCSKRAITVGSAGFAVRFCAGAETRDQPPMNSAAETTITEIRFNTLSRIALIVSVRTSDDYTSQADAGKIAFQARERHSGAISISGSDVSFAGENPVSGFSRLSLATIGSIQKNLHCERMKFPVARGNDAQYVLVPQGRRDFSINRCEIVVRLREIGPAPGDSREQFERAVGSRKSG